MSEQLGHASAAFTLDTYSHVLPHMQDEAASKRFSLHADKMMRLRKWKPHYLGALRGSGKELRRFCLTNTR